jgi:hypothetical protein
MITTVTVNQWRIKSNAETGAHEPVLCVNKYTGELDPPPHALEVMDHDLVYVGDRWGWKIGDTRHTNYYERTNGDSVRVFYDPVNKTPCGASAWMEIGDD